MTKKAKEWITTWHQMKVNDATKVIFVGKNTTSLEHRCFEIKDFRRESHFPETKTLRLYQPTHFAESAAFCPVCNILFLGRDPDE